MSGQASFVISLKGDSAGVAKATTSASGHFKKLENDVSAFNRRSAQWAEKFARAQEQVAQKAFNALPAYEQMNRLLAKRDDLNRRFNNSQSERAQQGYLVKILEVEKQIEGVQKKRVEAAKQLDQQLKSQLATQLKQNQASGKGAAGGVGKVGPIRELLDEIPGFGRAMNILEKLAPFRAAGAAVGGIGVAGAVVRSGVRDGVAINDAAYKAGTSAKFIQAISKASDATLANPADAIQVLVDLQKNRSSALLGQEEQVKHFEKLGYSIERLKQLSPEELFIDITKRVKDGSIAVSHQGSLFAILEQNAKNLLPAMKRGFGEAAEAALKTGPAIRDGIVNKLDEAAQAYGRFWSWITSKTKGAKANLAASVFEFGGMFASGITAGLGAIGFDGAKQISEQLAVDRALYLDKDFAEGERGIAARQAELDRKRGDKDAAKAAQEIKDKEKAEQDAKELEKLKKKNKETDEDIYYSTFGTKRAKREKMLAARRELEKEIQAESDPLKRERLIERSLEFDRELVTLHKDSHRKGSRLAPSTSDKFQELGLFIGSQTNQSVNILKQQLDKLEESVRELKGLRRDVTTLDDVS